MDRKFGEAGMAKKILVVDDAPEIVEVVSICLQLRWGHAEILSAAAAT